MTVIIWTIREPAEEHFSKNKEADSKGEKS